MFNRDLSADANITGKIFFKLDFKQTTSNLNVFVAKCENLAIGNPKKNSTNPYVFFLRKLFWLNTLYWYFAFNYSICKICKTETHN